MIDIAALKALNLFEGLSDDQLTTLAPLMREASFTPDQLVLERSSLSADLFVLLEGRVSVEITTVGYYGGETSTMQLAILRPGDIFGEIAFLDGRRRSAAVTALDSLRVLQLERERALALFDLDPHMGYVIMRNVALVLAQRLIHMTFMWRDHV
ncbi:MAG: cyclic nucleotide-binding domain-containing protein [Magnetococcales bacterium]|nr:cyclic nucleotide-binding domain-containing protein [Magnetococcales bacterium]